MARFQMTVKKTVSPFRDDIVGSFLRPRPLREARARYAVGDLSVDGLKQAEDEAIAQLVAKQQAVGLRAITDGEFRRSWWHLDFFWGLNGVEKAVAERGYAFHGVETRPETARLAGRIGGEGHPFVDHFSFLSRLAGSGVVARQTIPAPAQLLAELQRGENRASTERFYGSTDELILDVAAAYRKVIWDLYATGCRSLQLDDCTWGMLSDERYRAARQNEGVDLEQLAEQYALANNLAIENRPRDLVVTTHVCRGNYRSTWASSGGYEPVARTLFGAEKVDAFYLEYDTERAGDFAPLRFVRGQQVVLGLFSSKTGTLEDRDAITARVLEATEYLDINQICLSPQCGFASTEEGNLLTEEEQWRKLRFIKEIADEIWP